MYPNRQVSTAVPNLKSSYAKILLIGSLGKTGGVSKYMRDIIDFVTNFDILVYDTSHDTKDLVSFEETSYSTSFNAGVPRFLTGFRQMFYNMLYFPFFLKKTQPEIIHICGLSFARFWERAFYIIVSKIFNKPVFIHYLGALDLFYEKSGSFSRILIVAILNQVKHVSFLSEKVRTLMSEHLNQDSVSVIPSCVDTSIFKADSLSQIPNGEINVLFVGGSYPIRKGIEDVISIIDIVLEATPNVNFTCSGSKTTIRFLNQINYHNWSQRVKFIGYFNESEKTRIYKGNNVFLLPSHNEGLPYAIIEALAAGMVIVSSDVGGIPEAVGKESGSTFDIGDNRSMADYIISLSRDTTLVKEISVFNKKLAEEKYSLEKSLHRIENIYRVLLSG